MVNKVNINKPHLIRPGTEPVWEILESVCDPEIPVLTIIDLGIVRDVQQTAEGIWEIIITPTYSGCPAMDMIRMQIKWAMIDKGYKNILIKQVLWPAWTTDWMSESGKQKLMDYGIAAPVGKQINQKLLEETIVPCPRCGSKNTKLVSAFSSTSCKAFFTCTDCLEPFDYFKCH